jgi:hypothetical protein
MAKALEAGMRTLYVKGCLGAFKNDISVRVAARDGKRDVRVCRYRGAQGWQVSAPEVGWSRLVQRVDEDHESVA